MGCSSCEKRRLQKEAMRAKQKQSLTGIGSKQDSGLVSNAPAYGGQGVLYTENNKIKARSPFILYKGIGYMNPRAKSLFARAGVNYNATQKLKPDTNRMVRSLVTQNKLDDINEQLKNRVASIYVDNETFKWVDLLSDEDDDILIGRIKDIAK